MDIDFAHNSLTMTVCYRCFKLSQEPEFKVNTVRELVNPGPSSADTSEYTSTVQKQINF